MNLKSKTDETCALAVHVRERTRIEQCSILIFLLRGRAWTDVNVRGVKAVVNINMLDSCVFVCVFLRLHACAHVYVRSRACTRVYVCSRERRASARRQTHVDARARALWERDLKSWWQRDWCLDATTRVERRHVRFTHSVFLKLRSYLICACLFASLDIYTYSFFPIDEFWRKVEELFH
jgi:hypothetical protein